MPKVVNYAQFLGEDAPLAVRREVIHGKPHKKQDGKKPANKPVKPSQFYDRSIRSVQ